MNLFLLLNTHSISVYLASDPVEAAEQAETYEKGEKFDSFIDEVAVPALLVAHHDQLRGVLPAVRQTTIAKYPFGNA